MDATELLGVMDDDEGDGDDFRCPRCLAPHRLSCRCPVRFPDLKDIQP
jgi:hypothetical protein